MIKRVLNEAEANYCDKLLTKLIREESLYDNVIFIDFIVNDYFKNVIKNKNNILLVYEENGIIEGYIYLKAIKDEEQIGYLIDGLYVEEEYRNQKIATKLLEYSLSILSEKKISFIDINVLSKNTIAKKLYKKIGFEEYKIQMRKRINHK